MRNTILTLSLLTILIVSSYAQTTDYRYPTNPDLTSTSSNTILPIGGAFDVGELGNATYQISIEVPMGINGMQPALSLTYNSLAGNGICGLGFNIAGLPAISRVSGNYYYDGQTSDMVANSGYVALAMDGQRLITGTNGQYYIENDPNTDITLKNKTITVKQNGKTLTFRQLNNNCQVYYLLSVTDNFGNRISYNYATENNCVYPSTITYGVGTGASTISFVYETRADVVNCFNKIPIQIKKRLSKIEIKKNAALWRSYNLSYSYSNGFSKISQIVEKNSKGEQKYPTEFSWASPATSTHSAKKEITFPEAKCVNPPSNTLFKDYLHTTGDFNGDGIDDIAFVGEKNIYFYLGGPNYDFFFSKSIQLSDLDEVSKFYPEIKPSYISADVDGDGKDELVATTVRFRKSTAVSKDNPFELSIVGYRPYGTRLNPIMKSASLAASASPYRLVVPFSGKDAPLISAGDFLSDGKTDLFLMIVSNSGNGHSLSIGRLELSDGSIARIVNGIQLSSRPDLYYTGDFDADGLLDLLVVSRDNSTIFWNRGTRTDNLFSNANTTAVKQLNSSCPIIRIGDFNGDGAADILAANAGVSPLFLIKNVGNRTLNATEAAKLLDVFDIIDTKKDDEKFCVEVTDFNNDGKADLLVSKAMYKRPKLKSYYRHDTNIDYWLVSDGDKFSVYDRFEWGGDVNSIYHQFVIGDFNGNGYDDILRFATNDKWNIYKSYDSESKSNSCNKITYVKQDNGRFISISYGRLTNCPKSMAQPLQYPLLEKSIPLPLVSKVVQSNGSAPTITTNYKYENLAVHLKGKGILGFSKIQISCPETKSSRTTTIESRDSRYYVPTAITNKDITGTYIFKCSTEITVANTATKRYFAYPSAITETDRYGKNTVTTNTYNAAKGYIESSKTVFPDKSYKLQKYQNYVLAGVIYHPHLVVTEQKHPDDTKAFSIQKYYEYNTLKGHVTKSIENYNTDFALTTIYKYDNDGNITEQSTFGKEKDSLSTIYKYDGSRRLVTEKRSKPLNTLTKYTYDNFDNLIAETDATDNANPLKTTYKYDAWGLNTETIFPDSTKHSTVRGWQGTRYFVATLGTATPWTKTIYDNAGHIVKEEKLGLVSSMSNQNFTTEYTYDIHGKPSKIVSKAGSYEETTLNRYDYDGSLMEHTDNAHTITYRYFANKTEVTDNGRKTITEYDDWGNAKTITMPDQSKINYKYFSNGKPKTITSLGATVSFQYYPNSLRKSITDSDAGTESYEYDSFGRVIRQTRGNVVTENTYQNGLLTQSKCGGIATTYNYDKKKRLTKLYNATATIAYAYDKYDRMTKETYSIDGRDFTYQYSYNDVGLLASKIFPDKSEERYSYKAGIHTNTNLVGKCSWTLYYDNYAKDGRHSTEITGGVFKDSYFNPDNTLKYVTFGSPNGGSSSDRIDYTYDRFQNMTSRKGKYTDTETFKYDASDRLTKIDDNYEYQYANNGNILYQTGVGNYEYKASQPHAVSSVDNENGVVKSLEQRIKYTPFRKPENITDDSNPDSIKTYTIYYSPDNERIKSVYKCNKDNVTTYYLPDYEEENANGVITSRHYIFSDFGNLAAVVFKKGDKSETYYAITDHLGSILKLVDDKVQSKYEATYTPFGVRTITKNNLGYNFPRGFTMHEHLDQFSLINANARLYDPYLAQFLSPDPLIQDPTNSQNFNRFSYCLNNPLKYSDPTGEYWWYSALSMGVNAIANGFAYKKSGQSFWQGVGKGIVSGVATANAGSAISCGGILSRGVSMAGVNVLTNGVDNLINNKSFFNNYQVAAYSGFAIGALEGASISKEMGKNMWWGNDIAYNRTQWSFFNDDRPDRIIYFDIPDVGSKSLNDCVPSTFAEIEAARRGTRTYEYFCDMTNYINGEGVVTSKEAYAQLLMQTFDNAEILETTEYGKLFTPQYMETAASNGKIFSVHFNGHADNVRALQVFDRKPNLNKLIFRQSRYNMTSKGNGIAIINIFRLR